MSAAVVFIAAAAGVFGLAIGSFLNVVAYRVPSGVSLLRESRCPSCESPVRWWQNVPVVSWVLLRGRCASCRVSIPAQYPVVELATALAFAGVAIWWAFATGVGRGVAVPVPLAGAHDTWGTLTHAVPMAGPPAAQLAVLVAYLWFAASAVVLTVIDLATLRLPHAITGTALGVCFALLTLACVLGADWWALGRAVAGALALCLFYALLRFMRPDGMGGGDVRLAAVVGLMLAWLGWGALLVGAFAAFLLGGVYGVVVLFVQRSGRRTAIPFGPWIIAGATVGILAGEVLWRSYASLLGGV